MPTLITARLATDWNDEDPRADYRVLCGRLLENGAFGCGGEIGTLRCFRPRDSDDADWNIWFNPAMVRDDGGVWQLARRGGRARSPPTPGPSAPLAPPRHAVPAAPESGEASGAGTDLPNRF